MRNRSLPVGVSVSPDVVSSQRLILLPAKREPQADEQCTGREAELYIAPPQPPF
jgi:hypothetical protein